MESGTRKILLREVRIFAGYCLIVILISIYSSVSRTVVDGDVHTRFFSDLFVLHLIAWLLVYVIIRAAVWGIKEWIKP
ncbi:MAG: hypothetical protein U9R44_06480 [Candidatus Omnitrophota bacterium]|nr:hypothetical protein [Candidatus Omnitrophota bacterium]